MLSARRRAEWLREIERAGRGLPPMSGEPVRVFWTRWEGVHAGCDVRRRAIVMDARLRGPELRRIFVHELFHLAWVRAGNVWRARFEEAVRREMRSGARGELGWSAEWRKARLEEADVTGRSRRWREYLCESFCDTAAWMYAEVGQHAEFRLALRWREVRRGFFEAFGGRGVRV